MTMFTTTSKLFSAALIGFALIGATSPAGAAMMHKMTKKQKMAEMHCKEMHGTMMHGKCEMKKMKKQ